MLCLPLFPPHFSCTGNYCTPPERGPPPSPKVRDFVIAVQHEEGPEVYRGLIKAPKILADIVESVAAAVFVDCNFDLTALWMVVLARSCPNASHGLQERAASAL